MKTRTILRSGLLLFLFIIIAINCSVTKLEPISIISAREHEILEPFIEEFEKEYKTKIEMHYKGSIDILTCLRGEGHDYDAVWPADSLWIALGDNDGNVKHTESVMKMPVVFGIQQQIAEQLGWTEKTVLVKDILDAVRADEFTFIMASAGRTGSGAGAYIGFLHALAGNPDVLSMEHLGSAALQTEVRELLEGVRRSSGSSAWLKDLFLESNYTAMVSYEASIIETNRALIAMEKEPLYILYPADGLYAADSPIGFLDRNNTANSAAKEATFLRLQEYLLSDNVQGRIADFGTRTAAEASGSEMPIPPVPRPSAEVIGEALNLYQTVFRKPSLTVFCLDYSGSMRENGGTDEVRKGMCLLFDQETAGGYMIQAGEKDITVVLPFSSNIFDMWTAEGNDAAELDALCRKIELLHPEGKTDMYTPVITALDILSAVNTLSRYLPAIIVITDGSSDRGRTYDHLQKAWDTYNIDIPVFTILYGTSAKEQLEPISTLTRGRFFNGNDDLAAAIRSVKGYN